MYKKAGILQVILLLMQIQAHAKRTLLNQLVPLSKQEKQISVLVSDLTHILFSLYLIVYYAHT
jgi:hypothetical protein